MRGGPLGGLKGCATKGREPLEPRHPRTRERIIRAAVARERDQDDVGTFGDRAHIFGALVAGGHEHTDLLAWRRLVRREFAPHLWAVVPIPGEPRRRTALARQAPPVLDAAGGDPLAVDSLDDPQGVLNAAVPARRRHFRPAVLRREIDEPAAGVHVE